MQFPSETPNMPFGPNAQQQQNNKMGNFMDQKPGEVKASSITLKHWLILFNILDGK